jgi:hypothetical protein
MQHLPLLALTTADHRCFLSLLCVILMKKFVPLWTVVMVYGAIEKRQIDPALEAPHLIGILVSMYLLLVLHTVNAWPSRALALETPWDPAAIHCHHHVPLATLEICRSNNFFSPSAYTGYDQQGSGGSRCYFQRVNNFNIPSDADASISLFPHTSSAHNFQRASRNNAAPPAQPDVMGGFSIESNLDKNPSHFLLDKASRYMFANKWTHDSSMPDYNGNAFLTEGVTATL